MTRRIPFIPAPSGPTVPSGPSGPSVPSGPSGPSAPSGPTALPGRSRPSGSSRPSGPFSAVTGDGLLDAPARWSSVATPAGRFRLEPVRLVRDLPLLVRWMNDPVVAAFWELAGPPGITEAHVRTQLEGDGRSVPCLGVLDGIPMSYWEIYRADLDPLARHYPARPHDTGIHLLVGPAAARGRGLGTVLLRAVAGLVLVHRPLCARVVAEPDVRNTASVSAFLHAGFRAVGELDLPGKRAALMVHDRRPWPAPWSVAVESAAGRGADGSAVGRITVGGAAVSGAA